MVGRIYKNTLKTVLRARSFWLLVLLSILLTLPYLYWHVKANELPEAVEKHYLPTLSPEEQEAFLTDWYSYTRFEYLKDTSNLVSATFLYFVIPVFTVVTAVLVLNRDHGDQFFEIEKVANVKPGRYLFGRLCAIVTLPVALLLVWGGALMHIMTAMGGGVAGMSLGMYLVNSTLRMLRLTAVGALPCILFFASATYLVGTAAKSGLAAALGGFGYVLADQVLCHFRNTLTIFHPNALADLYFTYLRHHPNVLQDYFYFFRPGGTLDPDFVDAYSRSLSATNLGKALLSIAFLVGVFAVCSAASYALLHKREL